MSNISLSEEVITLNDVVCLFNKQGELPFKVEIPNKETIKAMQETNLEPMTLDELSNLWDDINTS